MKADALASIITASISAGTELIGLLLRAASDLQQNAELSPEASKALDEKIANLSKQDWWKIEE